MNNNTKPMHISNKKYKSLKQISCEKNLKGHKIKKKDSNGILMMTLARHFKQNTYMYHLLQLMKGLPNV